MQLLPAESIERGPCATAEPADQSLAASAIGRDERIDFWRGICILGMVSWHLLSHPAYPRPVSFVVIQSLNFVAEGFVLLAGASIGLRLRRQGGAARAVGPYWLRAGRLLLLHYAMVAALVVVFSTTDFFGPRQSRPISEWIREVVQLSYQPYLADILTLFVFLFALAPGMLAVEHWAGWRLLLTLSLVVYAVAIALPDLAALNAQGAFVVNGWQLYFVLGILFGRHYAVILETWSRNLGAWLALNILLCLLAGGYRLTVELHPQWKASLPLAMQFHRHPLTLARTLEMLLDMHLVALLTVGLWPRIQRHRVSRWAIQFGRQSLRVFVASVALDYLFKGLLTATGWKLPANFFLWGCELMLLYLVATRLENARLTEASSAIPSGRATAPVEAD